MGRSRIQSSPWGLFRYPQGALQWSKKRRNSLTPQVNSPSFARERSDIRRGVGGIAIVTVNVAASSARRDGQGRVERLILLICPTGGLLTGVSSPLCKNILLRHLVETDLLIPPSRRTRGAYRDRHGRRARDAMDAVAFCARGDGRAGRKTCERSQSALTRDDCCGRRSRVVLTPRRWRQVCGGMSVRPD
jgi:hypothetical protein